MLSVLAVSGCARFGFETLGPLFDGTGAAPNGPDENSGGAGVAGDAMGAGGGAGSVYAGPDPVLDSGAPNAALDASGPNGSGSLDAGPVVPLGCAPDVPLRQRAEGQPVAATAGVYDSLSPGWSRLARNSEWITLQGQGYFPVRWTIEYATRAGQVNLPTFNVTGTLLRVGGGGGYHLDDPLAGTTGTYMGNAEEGISYMAPGAETPWHHEYYYLDGEVTIVLNENQGLHNVEVQPQTYQQVITPGSGLYSPGIVCDRE